MSLSVSPPEAKERGTLLLRQYRVPERFGIASILTLTTTFAILFGALRYFDAPPSVYIFLGAMALSIWVVQMIFGSVPRGASAITGGLIMPIWVVMTIQSSPLRTHEPVGLLLLLLFFTVALGALLGYCTGALAAGVFLLLDVVEEFVSRHFRNRSA